MVNHDQKNNHSVIGDNVGYSLGEKLVNLFEWLLGFPK